jgi:hypothetical protein
MATLSGNKIKDTYQSLVKFSDNGNITVGAKQLTDGFGNNSPMFVSTTQVGIGVTPESGLNLHVYGDAKIGSNLTVIGNLVVEGSTTTVGTDTLTVKDPLIVLANNNTSTDAVDIGFYGKYTPSGTTLYSGLFREALTGKYRLFKDLQVEPTTTVNTSGTGYAVASLLANLEGNVTGNLTGNVTGGTISGTTGTFSGNVLITNNSTPTLQLLDTNNNANLQIYAGVSEVVVGSFSTHPLKFVQNTGTALTIDTSKDATFVGSVTATGFSGGLTGNVTGNVTGNLTGNVTGGTISGVLADGVTATTQTDGDNSTKVATTAYVDTAITGHDTLAEVLAEGNTTGGTDIAVSSGDDITFTSTSKAIFNTALEISEDGSSGGVIKHDGTGGLVLKSDAVNINGLAGGVGLQYVEGGAISLRHNNSLKLETTSYGINVTGAINADNYINIEGGTNPYLRIQDTTNEKYLNLYSSDNESAIVYTQDTFKISSGVDFLNQTPRLTIDSSGNATFAGQIGLGGTGIFTNSASLNIDGLGLAIKNDTNGSNNNWSLIKNTDTGSSSNLVFISGAGTAVTINHDKSATFGGHITLNGDGKAYKLNTTSYDDWQISVDSNGFIIYNETDSRYDLKIDGSGNATFAGEVTLYAETQYLNFKKASSNDILSTIVSETDAGTGGKLRFLTKRNGDTQLNALTLDDNQNATFAGSVNITGGTTNGLNITTSGTQDTIKIDRAATSDNAITKYQTASADKWIVGLRNTGDDNFRFYSYGTSTDVLTINQADGNATFAGDVIVPNGKISTTGGNNLTISGSVADHAGLIFATNSVLPAVVSAETNNIVDLGQNGNVFKNLYLGSEIISGGGATFAGEVLIASGEYLSWGTSGTTAIEGSTVSNKLAFFTQSTERMRIDSSGNLLLTKQAANSATVGNQFMTDGSANSTVNGDTVARFNRLTSNGEIIRLQKDTSTVGSIGSTTSYLLGDLGIGTTSPSTALHIDQPSNDRAGGLYIERNGSSYGLSAFVNSGGYGVIGSNGSFTTDILTMDLSNGNVGIGTGDPNQTGFGSSESVLTVKGTASGGRGVLELIGLGNGDNDSVGVLSFMSQSETQELAAIKGLRHTSDASGKLTFSTSNSERMRIDNSGNVGIGTTSPTARLDILTNSATGDNNIDRHVRFRADNGEQRFNFFVGRSGNSANLSIYNSSEVIGAFISSDNDSYFNGGNVGIGTTSPTYKFHVASSNNVSIFEDTSGSSGATFCLFNAPSVFAMGSITRNGSATSVLFNTSSDYRLKEDLQDFNALDLVDNIKAYDYKWKNTEQRDYGFVAHELQEVIPNIVTGDKDGEQTQSVDYSKLTPVLLKAIQEQQEIINNLKSRIETLENK